MLQNIILLILYLIPLSLCQTTTQTKTPRLGVTGEACRQPEYCEGNRNCVDLEGAIQNIPCSKASESCICFPTPPQNCEVSNDCEARESCTRAPGLSAPICVSSVIIAYTPDLNKITGPEKRPTVSDSEGKSYYPCTSNSECVNPRQCALSDGPENNSACKPGQSCVCSPPFPQLCVDSTVCDNGEVCTKTEGISLCIAADVVAAVGELNPVGGVQGITPFPTPTNSPSPSAKSSNEVASPSPKSSTESSKSPTPSTSSITPSPSKSPGASTTVSPSPSSSVGSSPTPSKTPTSSPSPSRSPSAVCIDVRMLDHLPRNTLVFEEHRLAVVLCDDTGSCATPGHIVMWRGKAMMMRTYCGIVKGCKEQEMLVNSPKYRRQMRVNSKTAGLVYTAFAARYETNTEEHVLRLAVRLGL